MTAKAAAPPRSRVSKARAGASLRVTVVRLAVGAGLECHWPAADWPALLECAISERCASLGWLRSSDAIRSQAPRSVAASWRAEALGAGELAAAQVDELTELIEHLEGLGITSVVMKGHPFALLVHGDVSARPSFDVDLYVPLEQRQAAHNALLGSGWQHLEGEAPAEGTYRRTTTSRSPHLELHSSLLDDPIVAHLPAPAAQSMRIDVRGSQIPVHNGDFLPVFLAVHLAKHDAVPLLWWLDYTALWNSLDKQRRARVRVIADRHGLAGFVSWAERGVSLVERIVRGPEEEATRALSLLDEMHIGRNALRVARLVSGWRSRAAVIFGWLVPPAIRRSPGNLARFTLRRLARQIVPAGRAQQPPTPNVPPSSSRVLEVPADVLASVIRETTSAGGSTWLKVRGTSMLPTIPRIAEVRVDPVPRLGLRRGDVALVEQSGSGLVMHRVVRLRGGTVELKGDNRFEADAPVELHSVIGVAGQIRIGNETIPVPREPAASLRFTVGRWHTFLRRRVFSA